MVLIKFIELLEDNECAICMTSYEEKDKIAVLPCSNKHKFHSACVRSWLIVNSKCPLCRSDVFLLLIIL